MIYLQDCSSLSNLVFADQVIGHPLKKLQQVLIILDHRPAISQ